LKLTNSKLIMSIWLPLLIVPALLFLAPLASAPSHVSPKSTPAIGFVNNGLAATTNTIVGNGYTTYVYTLTQTENGTNDGSFIGPGSETVYSDGFWTSQGTATFTGTIDGVAGTATITYQSQGVGNNGEGSFTIAHGTGALAGVHEQGKDSFGGPGETYTGSYWGTLHLPRS
jgi:hypothetical protein